MIVQSKMNIKNCGTYNEARTFLRSLPLDAWIKFSNIPQAISFQVCDLLDIGFYPSIYSVFDETFEHFLVTRRIITEELEFHLKMVFNPYSLIDAIKPKVTNCRKVVDTETGIVYDSTSQVIELNLVDYKYKYLGAMFRGKTPNKTKFKYYNPKESWKT